MIDTLIIGAGPSGLCAAKTFLQRDPSADVVLLDARASLGGVWSREQLYPTLRTNNLRGTLDFADFPMGDGFGAAEGEHVAGEAMHAYLDAYAGRFGVRDRIRFGTRVVEVRRREGGEEGWAVRTVVQGRNGREEEGETLRCRKLVVATGVLSVPHMPDLKGLADFGGLVMHSSELGPRSEALTHDATIGTVAVLGGGKSAYDAVYLAATTGHKVRWIIRKSGRGPVWVFPPHTYLGPFRAWKEKLVTRRFFSFMSPCVWPDFSGAGWLRRFLHRSWLGKRVVRAFWGVIHHDTIRDCGYRTDEKFGVLEPEQNPFWYGTASGVINYEQDFYSHIRSGQVHIHREDISHLSSHAIHLADGSELSADAFIAATGFSAKPTISFEPASIHSNLGLPTTHMDKAQRQIWAELDAKADRAIATQFPQLLSGISSNATDSADDAGGYTPWRLYRGIAPPGLAAAGDRSLVFLGMFSNLANTTRLEVQCLWALAYLEGRLPLPEQDRLWEDTALSQRWAQHRAPYGHGRSYPDLVFDQLPYWDLLLSDLGLETRRKGWLLRELFEPYSPEDYTGVVEEWMVKNRE